MRVSSKWLWFAGLCLTFLTLMGVNARALAAQNRDAYALIDAVNRLRAANGLPAYQVNGTLMSIARTHSAYQASVGAVTHSGPGGTRPRDRAAAAGYGGGAQFFISENIAGGTDLSVQTVISWWQGDAPHLNTMLGPNYRDAGAGVATAGNYVYYTLDVAYTVGGGAPPAPGTDPTSTPAPVAALPVQVAAPARDGSIIHVVETGQTLIGIANAYQVSLSEILALNSLGESALIFPGDKILIRPAYTPTPSPTFTATPTPPPPTRRPTATPTRTPPPQVAVAQETGSAPQPPEPLDLVGSGVARAQTETERGPLLLGLVLGALLFLLAPVLIGLRRRG